MRNLLTIKHIPQPLRFTNYLHTAQKSTERPNNLDLVVVHKADTSNINRIEKFYLENYLKDDPVVKAANIPDLTELTAFLRKSLEEQSTLLVTDKLTQEILAAASGGPTSPMTAHSLRKYADTEMRCLPSKRVVNFWADIMTSSNLFDQLQILKFWDLSFMATVPLMRRIGLCRFLTLQSRKLATKNGFSVMSMECTNHYAARVAKRVDFHMLPGISVQSFVDGMGKPWISTAPPIPHGEVVIAYSIDKEKVVTEPVNVIGS